MVSATASFCWFVQLGTCLAPSLSLVASSADPDLSCCAPSSSLAMPSANWAFPEATCWAPSRSWVSLFVRSCPLLPTWSRADPSGLPGARRPGRHVDRGVAGVGEALPDLGGELMLPELILHAAQRVCQRILSRGELIDHRRQASWPRCPAPWRLRRSDLLACCSALAPCCSWSVLPPMTDSALVTASSGSVAELIPSESCRAPVARVAEPDRAVSRPAAS